MRIAVFPLLVLAACGRSEKGAGPPEPVEPAPAAPESAKPAAPTPPETKPADAPPPVVLDRNETPSPGAKCPVEFLPDSKPLTGSMPGDLVPAFTAQVRRAAKEETLDSRATKSTTVYVVESVECPFCNDYAARVKALETKYAAKDVDFVHVLPNHTETDDAKVAWVKKQGYAGGLVLDKDAAVAKKLDADHTPTVYVVGKDGVIAYRGAIDDDATGDEVKTQYVADALDAVLAGKPVAVKAVDPPG